MADGRRSSRSKKTVDYSNGSDNGDSDGDFAEPTPPVAKKPPKAEKEKSKKTKTRPSKQEDDDCHEFRDTTRGRRKARKVQEGHSFDRELELALELSRVESSQETEDENSTKKTKAVDVIVHAVPETPDVVSSERAPSSPQANKLQDELKLEGNEESDDKENLSGPFTSSPAPTKAAQATSNDLKRGRCSEDGNMDTFDAIEVLELSDISDHGGRGKRSRRKAAVAAVAKQRDMVDEDDDDSNRGSRSKRRKKSDDDEFDVGAALELDASDGGCGDDGDEDFSVKAAKSKQAKTKKEPKKESKKNQGQKSVSKPRKQAKIEGQKNAAKAAGKSPAPQVVGRGPIGRTAPMKGFAPPSSSTTATGQKSSESLGSPRTGMVALKRSLVVLPAGSGNNPLGGVKLVSPGQPLRLGLSKFARVKPLHGNVKV